MLLKRVALSVVFLSVAQFATAQSQPPNVYNVLPYSAIRQGAIASITSYHGSPCSLTPSALPACGPAQLNDASNFQALNSIVNLSSALNASIATALAVIPLASPASGVITKTDLSTGAELPVSSTLGPIFTERAETIGKNRFYIGLSNQDFHFTSLNGQCIKTLRVLDPGGVPSTIQLNGQFVPTFPATVDVAMDVRLSQDVAFLTYGVTNRFDISVGLPMVHAGVSSRTSNNTGVFQRGRCPCLALKPGRRAVARKNLAGNRFQRDRPLRGRVKTFVDSPGGSDGNGSGYFVFS